MADGKHTAHTPGPWEFLEAGRTEEEGNACRPLTICGGNNDDLANVYSRDDATVAISREEAIANARLIAAAPELLAVLQRLEAHCRVETGFKGEAHAAEGRDIRKQVQAAITKATGAHNEHARKPAASTHGRIDAPRVRRRARAVDGATRR